MTVEKTSYYCLDDMLRKILLSNENGYFELFGANVCFFKQKDRDSVQIFFPFKIFEFTDKEIADNPKNVIIKLCGYIEIIREANRYIGEL